jgi:hypothetical protein
MDGREYIRGGEGARVMNLGNHGLFSPLKSYTTLSAMHIKYRGYVHTYHTKWFQPKKLLNEPIHLGSELRRCFDCGKTSNSRSSRGGLTLSIAKGGGDGNYSISNSVAKLTAVHIWPPYALIPMAYRAA